MSERTAVTLSGEQWWGITDRQRCALGEVAAIYSGVPWPSRPRLTSHDGAWGVTVWAEDEERVRGVVSAVVSGSTGAIIAFRSWAQGR